MCVALLAFVLRCDVLARTTLYMHRGYSQNLTGVVQLCSALCAEPVWGPGICACGCVELLSAWAVLEGESCLVLCLVCVQEKAAIKVAKDAAEAKYKVALIDGRQEQVGVGG